MSLISVTEFGKIGIGEFSPFRPSVTSAQADVLTNLKPTYGFDVFKYANSKILSAQQFVGVVQLGQHTIEILPKVDGDVSSVRRNLVAMLVVALDLEISEGEVAQVAVQHQGVLEILIRLFCDKLFAQVHRGLVSRYEGHEENLPVLRGRLGVVEQIRLNAANPERLFCRFDEFHADNPLNQVLKAAIRTLLAKARALENQRQLTELLLVFEGISDRNCQSLPWSEVVFDRLNERYRGCFRLAELFLKGTPPDVTGGVEQGFSLLFDMNTLFEEYVGRMIARALGPRGFQVTLQGPQKFLAYEERTKRSAFAMRPDVIGKWGLEIAWILDTKWKQLSNGNANDGVIQSDLYQMYAYGQCYECSEVVLLYPHCEELGNSAGVRNSYYLNPWLREAEKNNFRRVRIATLDLRDLKTVQSQLRELLLPQVEC